MAYFRLTLAPGIDKQNTEYGAEGGWIDADNVRFRYGLPEKIGGWEEFTTLTQYLVGMESEVFTWNNLVGVVCVVCVDSRVVRVITIVCVVGRVVCVVCVIGGV